MIGNHSVPVIVDAYLKGFRGFDVEKAYNAIKTSLTTPLPKSDWTQYDKYGYFPFDMTVNESVSRTLECCYDDWCAAQLAKALGKEDDYNFFINRSSFYKNLFDPSTGLMAIGVSHSMSSHLLTTALAEETIQKAMHGNIPGTYNMMYKV